MKINILLFLMFIITNTVFAQNEQKPEFIEIYFTKRTGERITGSVTVNDKVIFMIIRTARAKGEKVVLTLEEDEEYFYKKQFLGGGSSIKFPVRKDFQKEKLIIYNAQKKMHQKLRLKSEASSKSEDISK